MRTIGTILLLTLAACGGAVTRPASSSLDESAWTPPATMSIEVVDASRRHAPREAHLSTSLHANGHATFRGESPRDHLH